MILVQIIYFVQPANDILPNAIKLQRPHLLFHHQPIIVALAKNGINHDILHFWTLIPILKILITFKSIYFISSFAL